MEKESNECELLIKRHTDRKGCSLMVEGYRSQTKLYYFCPCDPDCQAPLCLECLQTCHRLHVVNKSLDSISKSIRNAICFCGERNHILPENGSISDFKYEESCLFMEWSTTSKANCYYKKEGDDSVVCMFCYNVCKKKSKEYNVVVDNKLTVKCSCIHEDYLDIFEKIKTIATQKPFQFEIFSPTQFFNMITLSKKSFDNSFHLVFNTLESLKNDLIEKNKNEFDFKIYTNNSPFVRALEMLGTLLEPCKDLFYFNIKTEFMSFIVQLTQRKFNYKTEENTWILKKNIFDIFNKVCFRKDFEPLPILTYKDIANLNPFQRIMYSDYIDMFPNIQEKYFNLENSKNYIDNILLIIEKYKNIKLNSDNSYDILRKIYSQCKKVIQFNKLGSDESMKFCGLNDEILYNALSNKNISLQQGMTIMKMLSQMVKCILYMAYHYNDSVALRYIKGSISIDDTSFFHGKNDTARMIYKNCTHILLCCRTIYKVCCLKKRDNSLIQEEDEEEDDKNSKKSDKSEKEEKEKEKEKEKEQKEEESLKEIITSYNYKIMFIATEVTALTLNYPDSYLTGLKRLLTKNQNYFYNYLSNNMNSREASLHESFRSLCYEIEAMYEKYYRFQVTKSELEDFLNEKIKFIFSKLNKIDYNPPFSILTHRGAVSIEKRQSTEGQSLSIKKSSFLNNLMKARKKPVGESENDMKSKILINKTPLIFTFIKSLNILLSTNSNTSIGEEYYNNLFKLLGFYVKDSVENCFMILSDNSLKAFLMLGTNRIVSFINLLEYIIKFLVKSEVYFSHIHGVMRVLNELVKRISGNPEFVVSLSKVLKILGKLSKIQILHKEHALTQIRQIMKTIYFLNPIFATFRKEVFNKYPEEKGTLAELIEKKEEINGYTIETLTVLFTKYLKITNYLFDDNSMLNEVNFLSKVLSKIQIPKILKDLTLFLPLRIELLRFFRIVFIDLMMNREKIKEYIDNFTQEISAEDNKGARFVFFQNLMKVSNTKIDLSIETDVLNYELKNFSKIVSSKSTTSLKKEVMYYFEKGIVLPLHVFINKCISIIYNLDDNQYKQFYEIVLHFLEMKKFILDQSEETTNEEFNAEDIFRVLAKRGKNQFSLLIKKINKNTDEVSEDINKMKEQNFPISDYKYIYSFFEKNIQNFIQKPPSNYLKDVFSKKNIMVTDEEVEKKRKEFKKMGLISNNLNERIFTLIIEYENDKTQFTESSLSQNLAEKNSLYDSTYRLVMLRPMFSLINSKELYSKYGHQNLWHIFRLLQYDTNGTQEDILRLIEIDKEKINKNVTKQLTNKSLVSVGSGDGEANTTKKAEPFVKTVDLELLTNLFLQNLISLIFEGCNPSSTSINEDYNMAYMIIKIMKYMCEDHNITFQTIFFEKIRIEYNQGNLNMFELMMCILSKVTLLSGWDKVGYEQDDNSVSYYYEIFFAMIEFSIEMVQGTSIENFETIIGKSGKENENSYFYKFLSSVKGIMMNNSNDSETLNNVRLDIMSFILAFVEEKKTPYKIIMLLSQLYNPFTIFDSIVVILKKVYLKSIGKEDNIKEESCKIQFNSKLCKFFVKKYFSVHNFSGNEEFELANKMYIYVKQLSNLQITDAKVIIDSIKVYTEEELNSIIDERKKKNTGIDTVKMDPQFIQNYFTVKFFENITKLVWIQGENGKPQLVLFTLDPTALFLSENTKRDFYSNVSRDSRSSKLFSLMEYITYFCMEISHNKRRIAGNWILNYMNRVNFRALEIFIFIVTVFVNIFIYAMVDVDGQSDDYKQTFNVVFYVSVIHAALIFIFLIIWFISKFSLSFFIEKEKYYVSNRKKRTEPLSCVEYMNIIFINTLLNKGEIVTFFWELIIDLIGIISVKNLWVFSLQVLILINVSSTLQNIARVIARRYKQLFITISFLFIAVYVFSSLAFFLLSKDFVHNDLQDNQENACGSFVYCFLTHMEFGLRTDGGIGEFIKKLRFYDKPSYFMGMFLYQLVFFFLIILFMLPIISGTIIDSFAEMREILRNYNYDMNSVCFICGGTKDDIEKEGENFEEHTTTVHNVWTYVDYMIGLKFVDPQETNAINSFVIDKIEEKKISWFPTISEETK